jgi:dienelactone hydrolase
MSARAVAIAMDGAAHAGDLQLPATPRGIVLFAHGSGSSRLSPRNRYVADVLVRQGMATLLFDLLTPEEDAQPRARFDIGLLTRRLLTATAWLADVPEVARLPIGYFGASTGAAAALRAAAIQPQVRAVVARGGRPDLAEPELRNVEAATLLIVGGNDPQVLALNRAACAQLRGTRRLEVIPGATHLFEEPGALEAVAELAPSWFERYLR